MSNIKTEYENYDWAAHGYTDDGSEQDWDEETQRDWDEKMSMPLGIEKISKSKTN